MTNKNPIAMIDQSSIRYSLNQSDNVSWLSARFHDGTGTDVESNGAASTLDMTAGTSTSVHQWAAAGWWSGSNGVSAGDRCFRDEANTTAFESLGRMDDNPDGCTLFCLDLFLDNKTGTGNEIIMTFGSSAASYYQCMKIQTDGDIEFFMQDTGIAHSESVVIPAANYSLSTRFVVAFLIDIKNKTIDAYIDDTATPIATGTIADFNDFPAPDPSSVKGFTIFASGAAANPSAYFGTTVRDSRAANLLVVKDTGSALRTYATQIISDMYNYPGDLSTALRNL